MSDAVADEPCEVCDCEIITPAMLRDVFPQGDAAFVQGLADELNYSINIGRIDSHLRLTHFLGQVRQEAGPRASVEEGFNYSVNGLKATYRYYRQNPAAAARDGRGNGRRANQEAIANNAYGGRIGNNQPGDGWRYRGRGLKQVTGRANYRDLTVDHRAWWGEDVDFEANPDLLTEPKYAVRSALWFWRDKGLAALADGGMTREVANSISSIINPGERGNADLDARREARWANARGFHQSGTFREVCFNTNSTLSNSKAEMPR